MKPRVSLRILFTEYDVARAANVTYAGCLYAGWSGLLIMVGIEEEPQQRVPPPYGLSRSAAHIFKTLR